ncbi:MAG: RNA polymerase sigma factor [Candidatus Aminicenantia bacterium]
MKKKKNRKLTDEELVRKCLDGDLTAFDKLVKRYERQIYNLIFRIIGDLGEAKDVTQEVFFRAFKFLKDFNPEFKFYNWIFKIATNLSINYIEREKKFLPLDSLEKENLSNQISKTKSPEEALKSKELKEYIQQIILSLPAKYRVVVLLRHLQDLTYEEIGFATGLPIGTVKTYLFRAKEILKKELKEVFEKYYEG